MGLDTKSDFGEVDRDHPDLGMREIEFATRMAAANTQGDIAYAVKTIIARSVLLSRLGHDKK